MPSSLAWCSSSSTGGHLRLAAAVDDVHVLRAQALGAAGGVHGHVAAADHRHGLGSCMMGVSYSSRVGLHQVDAGQVLVGGVDAR